jgi:F0F1-type ATP synthase membrane subunit c/vacuolar-type H+-ATPase subunit K
MPNAVENYRTMLMIWGALFASQFLFLVIIFFSKPEIFRFDFSKPLFGENPAIVIAFAALALTNLALSFVMKKRAVQQAIEKREVSYVQTGLVLACAFCESISLLGFVLAFAFSYQYFFLWFALGIVGIILHFPRRDDVMAATYKK